MDITEAQKIKDEFKNSLYILDDVHPNAKAYFLAEGFLEGCESNLKKIEELEKKLVIEIDGKEITLGIDSAEKLFNSLKELFDKKVIYIPSTPIVIERPYQPWYWQHPHIVYTSTTGKYTMDQTYKSLSMQIK